MSYLLWVAGLVAAFYFWLGGAWLTVQTFETVSYNWDWDRFGKASLSGGEVPVLLFWPAFAAIGLGYLALVGLVKAPGFVAKVVRKILANRRVKTPEQVINDNNPTDILVNLVRQQILLSPELVEQSRKDDRFDQVVFKKQVRDAEVTLEAGYNRPSYSDDGYYTIYWLHVDKEYLELSVAQRNILKSTLLEAKKLMDELAKAERKKKAELAACEAMHKLLGLPKPDEISPASGVPLPVTDSVLTPV